MIDPIECRQTNLEEIIELRESVIIRGTDRDSPYFEGDRDETTLHFGAFQEDRNVACLTFLLNEWEGNPAWQLRGMASDPSVRGTGVGAKLLGCAEVFLSKRSPIKQLWCNARSSAVGFYKKQGWTIESDEFTIAKVGPHYKMKKALV